MVLKMQIFNSLFLKKFSTIFNNVINMYFCIYKQLSCLTLIGLKLFIKCACMSENK